MLEMTTAKWQFSGPRSSPHHFTRIDCFKDTDPALRFSIEGQCLHYVNKEIKEDDTSPGGGGSATESKGNFHN